MLYVVELSDILALILKICNIFYYILFNTLHGIYKC